MTDEHLKALLKAGDATEADGWSELPEGRHLTLYVSSGGASLSVSRIEAVKRIDSLIEARTVKGERFVLAMGDVYAGAVEGPAKAGRRAGFV